MPAHRDLTQREIEFRAIDERQHRRNPMLALPWNGAAMPPTKACIATRDRMAERERKAVDRQRKAVDRQRDPYTVTDLPKNGSLCLRPLHQGAHGAVLDVLPGDSDVIHNREVLGLLPIIEDQTSDPLFDSFGIEDGDWLRTRVRKPAWHRQLHAWRGRSCAGTGT